MEQAFLRRSWAADRVDLHRSPHQNLVMVSERGPASTSSVRWNDIGVDEVFSVEEQRLTGDL